MNIAIIETDFNEPLEGGIAVDNKIEEKINNV